MAKRLVEENVHAESPTEMRTNIALQRIRDDFPKQAEKSWRLYNGRGIITTAEKMETARTGKRFDYFEPCYSDENPCPFPVKIDKTRDWDDKIAVTNKETGKVEHVKNQRPCGHTIAKYKGKDAQARAIIHCEEHLQWFLETEGKKFESGVPESGKVKAPRWADDDGPGVDASPIERKIFEARKEMKNGKEERGTEEKRGTEVGAGTGKGGF